MASNKPKSKDIIRSFTEDQKAVYDNLMGNAERLKGEWEMCRKFYADASKVVSDKNIGPEVRLFLINTVCSYWERRGAALERTMKCAGMDDILEGWKKQNAKSKEA